MLKKNSKIGLRKNPEMCSDLGLAVPANPPPSPNAVVAPHCHIPPRTLL